jgi:hypothetical protein
MKYIIYKENPTNYEIIMFSNNESHKLVASYLEIDPEMIVSAGNFRLGVYENKCYGKNDFAEKYKIRCRPLDDTRIIMKELEKY